MYVQGVSNSGGFSTGLGVTYDYGKTWTQFASFPEVRRDLPKMGPEGSAGALTILYQAIRTGWDAGSQLEIWRLVRIHQAPGSQTGVVHYPAMSGFGGLGMCNTMFIWYMVFAVDPGNPYHLIAPDVINKKMMESHDGGDSWSEMAGLTNLVTDGGRQVFRRERDIVPVACMVSFCPQDPHLVLVGTREGGMYVSAITAGPGAGSPARSGSSW